MRENGVTGDLEVATSEEFGSGQLAGYGVDDSVGAPVYCDGAGQVRTVPEHTSSTAEVEETQGSTAVGVTSTVNGPTATLVVNNPSSVRACNVLVSWSVAQRDDWADADSSWTDLLTATRNGIGLFTLPAFQAPNNAGPMAYTRTDSVQTLDSLPGAGTVTYLLQSGVTSGGDTTGVFTSSVAIRALVVTA